MFMVPITQLAMVMKGIAAAHIKEHGPESLLPGRKGPIGPGLCRLTPNTPDGTKPGSKLLNWRDPLFLCPGAMFALPESKSARKPEVALPNGEDLDGRRLRRSSLLWEIDRALHADPPPELLRIVVAGRDKAVIKSPSLQVGSGRHHLGRAPNLAHLRPRRRSQRGDMTPADRAQVAVPRTAALPDPAFLLHGAVRPHASLHRRLLCVSVPEGRVRTCNSTPSGLVNYSPNT